MDTLYAATIAVESAHHAQSVGVLETNSVCAAPKNWFYKCKYGLNVTQSKLGFCHLVNRDLNLQNLILDWSIFVGVTKKERISFNVLGTNISYLGRNKP